MFSLVFSLTTAALSTTRARPLAIGGAEPKHVKLSRVDSRPADAFSQRRRTTDRATLRSHGVDVRQESKHGGGGLIPHRGGTAPLAGDDEPARLSFVVHWTDELKADKALTEVLGDVVKVEPPAPSNAQTDTE
jgi:hypothetical protein